MKPTNVCGQALKIVLFNRVSRALLRGFKYPYSLKSQRWQVLKRPDVLTYILDLSIIVHYLHSQSFYLFLCVRDRQGLATKGTPVMACNHAKKCEMVKIPLGEGRFQFSHDVTISYLWDLRKIQLLKKFSSFFNKRMVLNL